jgi:hypothetical protein
MQHTFRSLLVLSSAIAVLGACKKDEEPEPITPSFQVPSSYISAEYDENTTVEYAVRSQLAVLGSYMKSAEDIAVVLDEAQLNTLYSGTGSPSLAELTPAYYNSLIVDQLFPEIASSSGNAYDPANGATATEGGVFGNRLLNRRAKESLQEVEKGLFEAALYNHLIAVSEGPLTSAVVDQMVAIYGAHPNFPNTNTAANTSTPDAFIALYAARRDKNDGNGLYTRTRDQFIRLKAAIEAGSAFNAERDQALEDLKHLIEKSVMATAIYYGHTATTKLTTSNPSETTLSGALHDLGEAVGFVHGWRAVPQEHRTITNAQIDEILALLLAPAGTEGTMYNFITDSFNTVPNIIAYQTILQDIYNFSDAEMEDFRQNWIALQGR